MSEKGTPYVLGRHLQWFDEGGKMFLRCNLYLGLGETTEKEISWWHNSSKIHSRDIEEGNIRVEERILHDVTKESELIILSANFNDSGNYSCSVTENSMEKKSLDVTIKVLIRKY